MRLIALSFAIIAIAATSTRADISPSCEFCKTLARLVKPRLNEHNINKFDVVFEEICRKLAGEKYHLSCMIYAELLAQYGRYLMNHSEIEFCKAINECKDPKGLIQLLGMNEIDDDQVTSGFSVKCEACLLGCQLVKDLLAEPRVLAKIDESVDFVCRFIPMDSETDCHETVRPYVKKVIENLKRHDNRQICAKLGQCKATTLADVIA